ncbi:MAG: carbamate kinase, partial [Candidatus Marinimicrobia bacterium]|nr:carbamate kinase [Candidatus Neomarinimicrobiota bacterium]
MNQNQQNKTVIIALGGNALSPKGEAGTITQQFSHTRESLKSVMHFVRTGYNICLTHGNGPQVGAEMFRNELTADEIPPLPLGVLVANTQGAIGYMIQQSLQNALYKVESSREVVSFISQMKVDRNDPAIEDPTKYIGRRYSKEIAEELSEKYQWKLKEQEPGEWRRVVPSPKPLYIFNGKSIKHLVDFGTIVVAGGGGGIPAYNKADGSLEGLNGVIDKDMSAALLGRVIKAQEMFIITDVDNIYTNFKQPNQQPIMTATSREIQQYLDDGHFQRGTMAPKIRSALYFLKHHGTKVV